MPAFPVVTSGALRPRRFANARHSASFCTPPKRRSESGFKIHVDGAPLIGTQMRPLSSMATPSFVCTPASDMETPSSPTRKGFDGSSSRIFSSAFAFGTGRQSAVEVLPGLPIDSAPAVSRPSSARMPMTSSGAAPSCRPMALSCVDSGKRFAAQGRNRRGLTRRGDSGIRSDSGKAPRIDSHSGAYVKLGPSLCTVMVPTTRLS
ncbi:MAG: hypothetical protein M5U16_02675 [Hyphomicrobium sp.]|nr:hypothetical protein [Hyphomicrobium sp.]